jgi:hypothetical protein
MDYIFYHDILDSSALVFFIFMFTYRSALEKLAARYSPDHEQRRLQEIDKAIKQVSIIELSIEHLTGKEANELAKRKQLQNN